MKSGNIAVLAMLATALSCYAQGTPPAAPAPATTEPGKPAATEQAKPAAAGQATPAATDQAKPAAGDDATPAASDQAKPAAAASPETSGTAKPGAAATDKPAAEGGDKATGAKTAAGVSDNTYVIGASDVVGVTVLKETNLSSSLLVRPDGMISMPLLGDVQAAGLTPLQLADQIANKLKKYMQDPNVSVVMSQINSKKVYLIGEVTRPNPIDMTPGMTLLEAISSAGGLTVYANPKKIYILRTEGDKHLKVAVFYKAALKGDSSFNIILKPGDTIVVP
jgi:polysaccharide export outer membrane protein